MSDSSNDEIWIGVAHVFALPGAEMLEEVNGAYVNIMTWASSPDTYRDKVKSLTDSLNLKLIGIQRAEPLAKMGSRGPLTPEFSELAEEVKVARHSIRYMTFHTYTEVNA